MSGRQYGYFKCSSCNIKWQSAQVFLKPGGVNGYYEQDCKKCNIASSPYRVEPLQCPKCGQSARECGCPRSDEHRVDPSKAHRSDLCHKCQSGHPCYQ